MAKATAASPSSSDEAAFRRWLSQEQVVLKGCSLGPNPDGGQVVVSVPDEAVLMPHTSSIADALEDCGLCNESGTPVQETLGLIIAVMAERCRGKHSRWAAYLGALPKSFPGMPMFWTAEEVHALKGTALWMKSMGQCQLPGCHVEPPVQVGKQFKEVVLPFINTHKSFKWPAGEQQKYELYRWATAVVSAYSFTLGEDKFQAMVPVWDMLNHITGRCNVRLHHSSSKGALQMITTKSVEKGEELVNDYGPLSDSELLRRFGFVEPHANPHNGTEIPIAMLAEACQAHHDARESLLDSRAAFLQQHDLVPSDGWFRTDAQGQPQPELVETIRILLLPSAEFDAFEKLVDQWRCPLSRPLTNMLTVCPDVLSVISTCARHCQSGLTAEKVVLTDTTDSFAFREAQDIVNVERCALDGLLAWVNGQDDNSLAVSCKQVWQHVRKAK